MEADAFVFLGFNIHAWITIVTVVALFDNIVYPLTPVP